MDQIAEGLVKQSLHLLFGPGIGACGGERHGGIGHDGDYVRKQWLDRVRVMFREASKLVKYWLRSF
ncbi:hypothetical protein D3C83_188220 [compost metagenome]